MKIIAFGASNSSKSINRQLARYAAGKIRNARVHLLDLNDFEMPLFSVDRERRDGIPQKAHAFHGLIKDSDGLVISFAEHNGAYTVAFKNILDWVSRIGKTTWHKKPILALSTSNGGRGAKSVLGMATSRIPFNDGVVVATFSLPEFHKNFDPEHGIADPELAKELDDAIMKFKEELEKR